MTVGNISIARNNLRYSIGATPVTLSLFGPAFPPVRALTPGGVIVEMRFMPERTSDLALDASRGTIPKLERGWRFKGADLPCTPRREIDRISGYYDDAASGSLLSIQPAHYHA